MAGYLYSTMMTGVQASYINHTQAPKILLRLFLALAEICSNHAYRRN
ncbi:hypothetical protein [Chlorogloeopsis fritschii]|nr:hypothetical protein [Chlorogloeopsis fritschii]